MWNDDHGHPVRAGSSRAEGGRFGGGTSTYARCDARRGQLEWSIGVSLFVFLKTQTQPPNLHTPTPQGTPRRTTCVEWTWSYGSSAAPDQVDPAPVLRAPPPTPRTTAARVCDRVGNDSRSFSVELCYRGSSRWKGETKCIILVPRVLGACSEENPVDPEADRVGRVRLDDGSI